MRCRTGRCEWRDVSPRGGAGRIVTRHGADDQQWASEPFSAEEIAACGSSSPCSKRTASSEDIEKGSDGRPVYPRKIADAILDLKDGVERHKRGEPQVYTNVLRRMIGGETKVVGSSDPTLNDKWWRVVGVDGERDRVFLDRTPAGGTAEAVRYVSVPKDKTTVVRHRTTSTRTTRRWWRTSTPCSPPRASTSCRCRASRSAPIAQLRRARRSTPSALAERLGCGVVYGHNVFVEEIDATHGMVTSEPMVVLRQVDGCLVDVSPTWATRSTSSSCPIRTSRATGPSSSSARRRCATTSSTPGARSRPGCPWVLLFVEQHLDASVRAHQKFVEQRLVPTRHEMQDGGLVVTRSLAEGMLKDAAAGRGHMMFASNGWLHSGECLLCQTACFKPSPNDQFLGFDEHPAIVCPVCPAVYCSTTCRDFHARAHKRDGCVPAAGARRRRRGARRRRRRRRSCCGATPIARPSRPRRPRRRRRRRRLAVARDRQARREAKEKAEAGRDAALARDAAQRPAGGSSKKKKKKEARRSTGEEAIHRMWQSEAERAARVLAFNHKQAVEHEERLHREAQAEVTRLRKVAIEASQRAALQAQPPPRGVELGDFVA